MSSEAIVGEGRPVAPKLLASLPRVQPGDVWGGLAAMLVAFPSAIAFGVVIFSAISPSLSASGALAGIIGAAAIGMVAPLVGRNGGFISAPCAPAAAVMGGFAAELAARAGMTTPRIVSLLALTALASALLQITYGALRAGQLIKYIPYQVVNGYLSGVAVIIAVKQIPKLLGVTGKTSLPAALTDPGLWKWQAVVVGVVTIVAMSLAGRITKKVPGAIIGLGSGIAAYLALASFRPELRQLAGNALVVGPIQAVGSFLDVVSSRAASIVSMTSADFGLIIGPALTLSVLLSIDTLKTGVVLDALTRRRHQSNRELVAQGVANVTSVFSGGVPGAGTMGPTLVNVTSGGRTLWSGVIEGALVLAGFLALGRLMAWVPIAALAGILLVIAFRMFDFHMFRLLMLPAARLDFLVIISVVIVAETVGLIQASAVGIALAILLFIRNQVRGSVILRKLTLREMRSKRRRSPEEMRILKEHGHEALLVQLSDDLFFGTTDQLFSELEADLSSRRFILLDFRRVSSMDYTAAHLLEQMHERLRERGGELLFSGMPSSLPSRQDIVKYMAQLGVVGRASGIPMFDTRDGALEWIEERILESAGWVAGTADSPLKLEEIEIFKNFDLEMVRKLSESVSEMSVSAGAKIFAAGDPSDHIYFVSRGRVHILLPLQTGKRHHVATICRGEFFGEMAFLDQHTRSADAEAATDTELFVMSRKAFDDAQTRSEEVAARFFERLAYAIAQRLRLADAELRALEER